MSGDEQTNMSAPQEPDWQAVLAAKFVEAAKQNQDPQTAVLIRSLQERLDKAEKLSAEKKACSSL